MKISVLKEATSGEKRVALSPEAVRSLHQMGFSVLVETGAGIGSGYPDALYQESGAELHSETAKLIQEADLLVKVNPPLENPAAGGDELDLMKPGSLFIGFFYPLSDPSRAALAAKRGVDVIAMDLIPRITRAQRMDALSSQNNLAGYRALLLGACASSRVLPMMMTAAGTISPARVLVLGAGVAGLQAVATAKRLGALVEVSDVRPEVKEQVESLGARYIEPPVEENLSAEGGYAKEASRSFLEKQREILAKHLREADIVVTTAFVPGKKAPVLVSRGMVEGMRPGSVIVDMAASQGGNCELTEPDRRVEHNGVLILGETHLASLSSGNASALYARNTGSLIEYLFQDGTIRLDPEDDILRGALVVRNGEVIQEHVRVLLQGSAF